MIARLIGSQLAFVLLTSAAFANTPPEGANVAPAPPSATAPQEPAAAPASVEPLAPTTPLATAVRDYLTAPKNRIDARFRTALVAVYQSRNHAPIWVGESGYLDRGTDALNALQHAGDWGLTAEDYKVAPVAGSALPDLAAADVALSLAVLSYASDARGGRIQDPAQQLSSYIDRAPQVRDPQVVLTEIATADTPSAYLQGLHPKHPQFEKLRQALLALRDASQTSQDLVRIPKGPQLKPGQSHEQIALIRQRLNVPVNDGHDANVYDDALVAAVKTYQSRQGLRADGMIGAGTRASLNDVAVPSPKKLIANMEQWRWMPGDLGDVYVWVNLPEYTLRVMKDGREIHQERVVIGKTETQTPVFSDQIEQVIFHPRWNVPDSIKVNELYPSLARGGGSFRRQGLVLSRNGRVIEPSSVNWSTADIRNYDVHQPSGGGNVMGVLKVTFPNKHAVYMHDTTSKTLFNETTRTFSHGCVRVRDPVRLAEVLLKEDKGWDTDAVQGMAKSTPEEKPIAVEKTIPVHLTYFTTWIGDDGVQQSFKDVYGHENRVMLALDGKFAQIDRGPDHLAPVVFKRVQPRYARSGNTPVDNFFQNIFGGF